MFEEGVGQLSDRYVSMQSRVRPDSEMAECRLQLQVSIVRLDCPSFVREGDQWLYRVVREQVGEVDPM